MCVLRRISATQPRGSWHLQRQTSPARWPAVTPVCGPAACIPHATSVARCGPPGAWQPGRAHLLAALVPGDPASHQVARQVAAITVPAGRDKRGPSLRAGGQQGRRAGLGERPAGVLHMATCQVLWARRAGRLGRIPCSPPGFPLKAQDGMCSCLLPARWGLTLSPAWWTRAAGWRPAHAKRNRGGGKTRGHTTHHLPSLIRPSTPPQPAVAGSSSDGSGRAAATRHPGLSKSGSIDSFPAQ